MNKIQVSDFNLEYTLECGQSFRWKRLEGFYYGVIGGSLVKLCQQGDILFYDITGSLDEEDLKYYLSLDIDLDRVLKSINVDEYIEEAISIYRGLRILKQDPWECLASFILSSYNNIPRIRQMISSLSIKFGACIKSDDYVGFTFPRAETIANAGFKGLEPLRLGFRADYLLEASRKIVNGHICLDTIKLSEYSIAKYYLLTIPGVGDKVADCILLFSMQKYEAFPVDVWIARIMQQRYFNGEPTNHRLIGSFARDYFGRYAGYAQEYLYYYARNKINQTHQELAQV